MTAIQDFRTRIAGIQDLLDRVAPGWNPDRPLLAAQVSPTALPVGELSRSALVLSVSYFEGFLKDLSDEAFDAMLDSRMPCSQIPDTIRGRSLMAHVRSLRNSLDPEEIWRSAVRLSELGQALTGHAPVTADVLARDETKRELTSIDPKKINLLLKSLGDDDLNRGPVSRFAGRLNGLKQIRDNAVHGNEQDLPPLGFNDVVNCISLLDDCADALSDRVAILVTRCVGAGRAS